MGIQSRGGRVVRFGADIPVVGGALPVVVVGICRRRWSIKTTYPRNRDEQCEQVHHMNTTNTAPDDPGIGDARDRKALLTPTNAAYQIESHERRFPFIRCRGSNSPVPQKMVVACVSGQSGTGGEYNRGGQNRVIDRDGNGKYLPC